MQIPEQPADHHPLPPLVQATLDDHELAQLLADVSACAEITSIIAKPAEQPTKSVRLSTHHTDEVNAGLTNGTFDFAQLRYSYGGQDWIDTLQRIDNSVKLVRIQSPKLPDADST